MSFTTATDEIKTALNAISGIEQYADKRARSLATCGGDIDGRYLLRALSSRQWPEAARDARLTLTSMELEVCTLLDADELVDTQTMLTRGKAIRDALQHSSLTHGTVVNAREATHKRTGKDRRLVWTWRFDLRHVEA